MDTLAAARALCSTELFYTPCIDARLKPHSSDHKPAHMDMLAAAPSALLYLALFKLSYLCLDAHRIAPPL
jgi:hypothetical protein